MARCPECGGPVRAVPRGNLQWDDDYVGEMTVPGVSFEYCDRCEDAVLLAPGTLDAIQRCRRERVAEWMMSQPGGCYLSATQTAVRLGLTKQALQQNRRIACGVIYSCTLDGRTYYHRDSVEQYAATGDGRFAITRPPIPATRRRTPVGTAVPRSARRRQRQAAEPVLA